jgi:hypothetical protein
MFFDVVLVLVAACGQGLTGYLGWRVTNDGVNPKRKKFYEAIFGIATACGILATVGIAYRNMNLLEQLHAKLHVDSIILKRPRPEWLAGMASMTNRGAVPAKNLAVACELTISPVMKPEDEDRLFEEMIHENKQRLSQRNGNEVLQGDNQQAGCVTRNPNRKLSPEEVIGIDKGTLVVYEMLLATYDDKIDKGLTTELCGHVYVNDPIHVVDCLNHNR